MIRILTPVGRLDWAEPSIRPTLSRTQGDRGNRAQGWREATAIAQLYSRGSTSGSPLSRIGTRFTAPIVSP